MYAIIYWRGEDAVFAVLTEDGQVKVFDKLLEADAAANDFEGRFKVDARVVSLEQVHE